MEQRNLLLAVVLSVTILLAYNVFVEQPQIEQQQVAEQAAKKPAAQNSQPTAGAPIPVPQAGAPDAPATPTPGGVAVPSVPPAQRKPTRAVVVAAAPRVQIVSPRLKGSIALVGARLDDLTLIDYRQTVDPGSPPITLLSPSGAKDAYFAGFGWASATPGIATPGATTRWTADRSRFAPGEDVTLSWNNGQGLTFYQVISVDENYMFRVRQRVRNNSGKQVVLYPYGLVSRTGTPEVTQFFILHEGLLGVFENQLSEVDYDDLQDEEKGVVDPLCRSDARFRNLPSAVRRAEPGTIERCTVGGWIGITDKYWLTALVPDQQASVGTRFKHWQENETDKYQVDFIGEPVTLAPGAAQERSARLFAGAKQVKLLDKYAKELGIARFDLAVDWGWLWFLTKPIFSALEYFYNLIGNFGLAILLLTVLIKLAFFPLANKSYKAMSRLKALQPQMMEIREKYKDDRVRQNQEMMALYKEQKANPMAGCFPILIQIPVFFALYKVLFVTIEMRHTPFFGWIQDLSAPDPLGLLTGFGLFQWDVPEMLMIANIGIWPIIMGGTMFLQQKLNPQPADPTQAKIFMMLPIVFTFLLGQFPAGLVIYWAWNNLLSIAQQWVIMRRMGVTVSGGTTAAAKPAPAPKEGADGKKKPPGRPAGGKTPTGNGKRRAPGRRSGGRRGGK